MEQIYNELKALHLTGMAESWKLMQETRKTREITLQDGLSLLLQSERTHRENSRTERLLRKAKFRYNATFPQIDFDNARGKDRDRIMLIGTCEYIRQGTSMLVTGPTGTGKSFLITAFGHQACINGYSTLYINMSKLTELLTLKRLEGKISKLFDKLAAIDLLIIDDFGMRKLDGQQLQDFMEIMEDRHGRHSTIISSQLPVSNWYDVLEDNKTIADAILDRIVRTSYRFELKGDSLRK